MGFSPCGPCSGAPRQVVRRGAPRARACSAPAARLQHARARAQVALSLMNFAQLRRARGQTAEAEVLLRRALTIREDALGPDHPLVSLGLCRQDRVGTRVRG
jgi:hypothetical protein